MPASAAFSGRTAAWLHGLDVAPCEPIEVIVLGRGSGWEKGGVTVRRDALHDGDVVVRNGFRTTSLLRTLSDLSRRLSLVEAVVITDMALHADLIHRVDLSKNGFIEARAPRASARRDACWNTPRHAPSRRWKPAFECCWC